MSKFTTLIKRNTKIKDAVQLMNSCEQNNYIAGIAVVIDDESRVVGVVTDGDIRQGICNGLEIDHEIEKVINFSPFTLNFRLSKQQMYQRIVRQIKLHSFHSRRYNEVILVDDEQKFSDLILMSDIIDNQIDGKLIGVYGLGFVGLTLASTLAESGLIVVGIDPNPSVIDRLQKSQPHFFENGLEQLLSSLAESNPIEFTTNYSDSDIDIHIVCVGTPIGADSQPDLKYIREVSASIAQRLRKDNLIIFRSTLPVGTMRKVVMPILAQSGLTIGEDFFLAFAPERTVEGQALQELRSLPQIVGGYNQASVDLTAKLFSKLTDKIVEVESLEAAEMVKLINNTYRDLVFSFANEVANICDGLNINAFKLIEASNERYPRNPIPRPSPGVGGICLSKDPFLYTSTAVAGGYKPILGEASRKINANGHVYVYDRIKKYCDVVDKDIKQIKIFLIGMAFKGLPETSDIRESMSLKLVEILPVVENIYVKDFVVSDRDIEATGCHAVVNIIAGFYSADVVLIMNNHNLNSRFDLAKAIALMNPAPLFFDGWNMFDQREVELYKNVYYATMGYMTARTKEDI